MKKNIITAVAVTALGLATAYSANAQTTAIEENTSINQNTTALEMSTQNQTYMYMCNLGSVITAVYDTQDETAKLSVYAPIWQLNNQTLTMQPSPTASGNLYTSGKYQWHIKDGAGVLSMTGSTVGDIKCEGDAISFL